MTICSLTGISRANGIFIYSLSIRVSSVLNKGTKSYGKQYLFDGNEETCWNSDEGSQQWIVIKFEDAVSLTQVYIDRYHIYVLKSLNDHHTGVPSSPSTSSSPSPPSSPFSPLITPSPPSPTSPLLSIILISLLLISLPLLLFLLLSLSLLFSHPSLLSTLFYTILSLIPHHPLSNSPPSLFTHCFSFYIDWHCSKMYL